MKIRKGFVSNSSSSSYVCNVCGKEYSGFDASLRDAEMYFCEHGHIYCRNHVDNNIDNLDVEGKRKIIISYCRHDSDTKVEAQAADEDKLEKILEDIRYDLESEMSSKYCPCYRLTPITSGQLIEYLLHERRQTRKEVEKEIKKKYNNYDEMLRDIKQ